MPPRRPQTLAPDSHRRLHQRLVAPVHRALPLPRLSGSRWRSLTLRRPFRSRSDSGLSVVDQSGLEDGSSRPLDRKSTRLNSSHQIISYAVFCLKKTNIGDASGTGLFDVGRRAWSAEVLDAL